jgi:hypothetical protein
MFANRRDRRLSSSPFPGRDSYPPGARGQFGRNHREAVERAIRVRHLREVAGTTAAFFACVVVAAVISIRMHPPSAELSDIPVPEQSAPSPM